MTATVSGAFHIQTIVKSGVNIISETEGVSPMILWCLIRQQADRELDLIKQDLESKSTSV
tara:strand:+ start:1185 stop:1364 length:180 start_codon:yes stop_codon:yes gene_type:complete